VSRFYNLGPWVWEDESHDLGAHWRSPAGTVGLFDMRAAEQAAGFFATDHRLGDSAYVEIGDGTDLREYHTTQAERDAWRSALSLNTGQLPDSITRLSDILIRTFEEWGDPLRVLRFKPPTATSAGNVEFHLGGHSLLGRKRFTALSAQGRERILTVVREDVRRQFELSNLSAAEAKRRGIVLPDRNLYRKVLTALQDKYRLDDYKLLAPADLRDHIEPPLPRETTITDDFNDTGGNQGSDKGYQTL